MEITTRIALLDEKTVNRIAAGEVVERPASVVKELVENSLDAGAKRVIIQVEEGGRKLVRVIDDGFGMNDAEAILSLQRHATSKIRKAEDLFDIHTLGFRGEGLPSIASVSHLDLISYSSESDMGVKISIEGGTIKEKSAIGAPQGTDITVRELFFNTPARLKFLKSTATEMSHIVELITKYVLAYPAISFRLLQHGQELMASPGSGDELTAVSAVWGKDIARGLAPLDQEHNGVRVRGFISPPHITRPTRGYQAFFVNNRPVRTRTLTAALDEAYRALTPEKRFPIALLMIEVEPSKVDVNVHPAKTEVKFQREGDVFAAVHNAIQKGLKEHGMMPEAMRDSPRPMPTPWTSNLPSSAFRPSHTQIQSALSVFAPLKNKEAALPLSDDDPFETKATTSIPQSMSEELPECPPVRSNALPFADLLHGLKILGQARNTFIVCETEKGLALIDQHVAHERVLYEKFCGIKGEQAVESQLLLTPVALTLDKRAALLLQEKLTEINELGYELEAFGPETFLIRAVPLAMVNKSYETELKDIVEELIETSIAKRLPVAREQIWITMSCKQAVKSGDPLSYEEMLTLVHQLAQTENPYLCPHGRPIVITLTNSELDRKFKRA